MKQRQTLRDALTTVVSPEENRAASYEEKVCVKQALSITGVALLVAVGVTAASALGAVGNTCPNPDGGTCLGALSAGTYQTSTFHPAITYTVPSGWSNFEDLPGDFLLVPPSGSLGGVNVGTSDYIGIYTSIGAAAPGCADGYAPGVGFTPKSIAHWFTRERGLVTTRPISASVGRLHGLRLDMHLSSTWKKTCRYNHGKPTVQLIVGVPPSGLVHTMIPHLTIRLYLLHYHAGTLAVEIDDVHKGHPHLGAYSRLLRQVQFGT